MRSPARLSALAFGLAGLCSLTPASAYELSSLRDASPAQFKDIASDLTAVLNDKTLLPAYDSGGVWSWGLGGYAATTFLHHTSAWESVIGLEQDHLDTAGVAAYVNLPHAVQLGLVAASIASTDDVLYNLSATVPLTQPSASGITLGGRASLGLVNSVRDFFMSTQSLELVASKALGRWRPYAGGGLAAGQFDARNGVELGSESLVRPKAYAGANWTMNLFDIAGEVEQIGRNTSLGLRINVKF